jgi:hypothetical protein
MMSHSMAVNKENDHGVSVQRLMVKPNGDGDDVASAMLASTSDIIISSHKTSYEVTCASGAAPRAVPCP